MPFEAFCRNLWCQRWMDAPSPLWLIGKIFYGKTKIWFEKSAGNFPAIKDCSVSLRIILTTLFKDKTRRPVAEIATGRTVMTEGLSGERTT